MPGFIEFEKAGVDRVCDQNRNPDNFQIVVKFSFGKDPDALVWRLAGDFAATG